MNPGTAPVCDRRKENSMREDSYGSKFREKMMHSMEEPAQSTAEKFQALNRRRKSDKRLDQASKVVLWLVWLTLGSTIIAQVVIYIGHRHGLQ